LLSFGSKKVRTCLAVRLVSLFRFVVALPNEPLVGSLNGRCSGHTD
jgi:hypothetical protein